MAEKAGRARKKLLAKREVRKAANQKKAAMRAALETGDYAEEEVYGAPPPHKRRRME